MQIEQTLLTLQGKQVVGGVAEKLFLNCMRGRRFNFKSDGGDARI